MQLPSSQHNQRPFRQSQSQSRDPPRSWHIQFELHRDRKPVSDCRLIESIASRSRGLQTNSRRPRHLRASWHNADGFQGNSRTWSNLLQCWGLQKGCKIPEGSHESLDNPPIIVQSIPVRKFRQQSINSGTLGNYSQPETAAQFTHNHGMPILATIDGKKRGHKVSLWFRNNDMSNKTKGFVGGLFRMAKRGPEFFFLSNFFPFQPFFLYFR